MDDAVAPELVAPYGQCPFAQDEGYDCPYGPDGEGNAFCCSDAARLHAFMHHNVGFTDINKKGAQAFTYEYPPGKLATRKLLEPTVDDVKLVAGMGIKVCSGQRL